MNKSASTQHNSQSRPCATLLLQDKQLQALGALSSMPEWKSRLKMSLETLRPTRS